MLHQWLNRIAPFQGLELIKEIYHPLDTHNKFFLLSFNWGVQSYGKITILTNIFFIRCGRLPCIKCRGTICHHVRLRWYRSEGRETVSEANDYNRELVLGKGNEFIPKINWLERKAPCFWVQGVTFRANKGVNFIIKIYENGSGKKKIHSPTLLLIQSLKANWIKWRIILCNYDVHTSSFKNGTDDE